MSDDSDQNMAQSLARIERELGNLKAGLGLLGLSACSKCGRFFRQADKEALFDGGELVCAGCVYEWWLSRSPQIGVKEREIIERKLVNWLVNYHNATIQHKPNAMEGPGPGFRMVIACSQCNGTGQSSGKRCHSCNGCGTAWLSIPAKRPMPSR